MGLNFCPKCGSQLAPEATFCMSCGANLSERKSGSEFPSARQTKSEIKPMATVAEQNMSSNVRYADFVQRALAWLIDIIIIIAVSSPLSIFINFGGFWLSTNFYNFILGFCYFWLLETYNKGQTLGKMALKLRTVDEKTLEVGTPSQYAINNILKATGFLILDVLIGIIVNSSAEEPIKKRLRITQNIALTAVIVV